MTKRRKQLLGAFGLVSVLAMTVLAMAMPAQDAAAYEATVMVTVSGGGPSAGGPGGGNSSVVFLGSINGASAVTSPYRVSGTSAGVRSVTLKANYTNKAGAQVTRTLVTDLAVDEATGDFSYDIDFEALSVALGSEVQLALEGMTTAGRIVYDYATIRYRAADVEVISTTLNDKGNPLAKIHFSSVVDHMQLMVFDKKGRAVQGNPVFVNASGDLEYLNVTRDQLNFSTLLYEVYLPMKEYNAEPGEYDLVVTAYDASGKVVSMNVAAFTYGELPNTPSTGVIFGDLNISRMDYILTGLIAFGAVAGFAVYLVVKRAKRG